MLRSQLILFIRHDFIKAIFSPVELGGTTPLHFFRKLVLEILANLMKKTSGGGGGLCTLSKWSHLNDIFGRVSPLEENFSNRGKGRGPKGRGPRHTFCPHHLSQAGAATWRRLR